MPAQAGSACFPLAAVADEEDGGAPARGPEAQPPRYREIESLGHSQHLDHDGRNGTAGNCFLGRPQQFRHRVDPANQGSTRRDTEAFQARPIGQSHILPLMKKLEKEQRRPAFRDQRVHEPQRKAEGGPAITLLIGKHFMQQPRGCCERRQPLSAAEQPCPLGKHRPPLECGDPFPQICQFCDVPHGEKRPVRFATQYQNKE